jgi:hypothetical protein
LDATCRRWTENSEGSFTLQKLYWGQSYQLELVRTVCSKTIVGLRYASSGDDLFPTFRCEWGISVAAHFIAVKASWRQVSLVCFANHDSGPEYRRAAPEPLARLLPSSISCQTPPATASWFAPPGPSLSSSLRCPTLETIHRELSLSRIGSGQTRRASLCRPARW